jgi:uncharacterized membrane protein
MHGKFSNATLTSYLMGVLHSTHPMQQSFSKWNSQASSAVDAVVHAWHVVPTFLTLYNAHIFWR